MSHPSTRCRSNGGRQVRVVDQRITGDALVLLPGRAHDARQVHARLVQRRLGAGEGDAVVGDIDDDRIVVLARLLEEVHQVADALVDARNGLIILRQFGPALGDVGQEVRDDHVLGIVLDLLDARVALRAIAEAVGLMRQVGGRASAAMRIGRAEVEEEGLAVIAGDDVFAVVGHLDRTAAATRQRDVELVDFVGGDVILADAGCAIAGLSQQNGHAPDPVEADEMMMAVLVPVLAVVVVVEAAENNGAAGTATGGGAERIVETHAFGREGIQVRRLDRAIAIAAQIAPPMIVTDDQDDVGPLTRSGHTAAGHPRGCRAGCEPGGATFHEVSAGHALVCHTVSPNL